MKKDKEITTNLLINILQLKLIPGIGDQTIQKILELHPEISYKTLDEVSLRDCISINQHTSIEKNFADVCKKVTLLLEDMNKKGISVAVIGYYPYPLQLETIYAPPSLLFYKGNILFDYDKSISIVGSRKASQYGKSICEYFVDSFSNYNMSIVSGLAYGIDGHTHQTALEKGLQCIGVTGHGLNHVYPKLHRKLFDSILNQGGAIVSEFFPDIMPRPEYFPLRNRIIAGLSRGTCIIEAGIKSGSLITAHYAFQENRNVYAVPNDITNQALQGCNSLIQKSIAMLVHNPGNILQDYFLVGNQPCKLTKIGDPTIETILISLNEKATIDRLSQRFPEVKINRIISILSELELLGLIYQNEYMEWIKKPS